jgi:hypothetical protein
MCTTKAAYSAALAGTLRQKSRKTWRAASAASSEIRPAAWFAR